MFYDYVNMIGLLENREKKKIKITHHPEALRYVPPSGHLFIFFTDRHLPCMDLVLGEFITLQKSGLIIFFLTLPLPLKGSLSSHIFQLKMLKSLSKIFFHYPNPRFTT